jgi:hypothetical protein
MTAMPAGARHFLRHFVEMLLAMLLGMAIAEPAVQGLRGGAPALAVLVMALAMSAPMAAWMRHRRHEWARVAEMAGAMLVPALVIVALLASGALHGGRAALEILHGAMVPSMLAAMLWRRGTYSQGVRAKRRGGASERGRSAVARGG